jgi:hypothetical protein
VINKTLGTQFKLPSTASETGLVVDFPIDGTPRPRYLGYTNEREMAEVLKTSVPSVSYRPKDEANESCEPTEKSLEAFKKKMELMSESEKRKKTATKEKKKKERLAKQRAWNHSVKRVQRYLGIRLGPRGQHATKQAADKSSKENSPGKHFCLLYSSLNFPVSFVLSQATS